MTRILTTAAIGLALVGLSACTNPDGTRDNRMTGATVGAIGGGLAGNIVGGDSRSTLIGAGLGAATGAVIGNQSDQQQAAGM
jgi:chemotaxis protein MotB